MKTPRKPAKTTTAPTGAPPPALARRGPDARAEAMRLLAEGYTLTSVAEALSVDRGTVREWRDSPAGSKELAIARKAREAAFADAVEDGRRIIKEALPRAMQILVDQLDDRDPAVVSLAARTIADRAGLPRTQRVEQGAPPVDLSKLTVEELAQYEALQRKLLGLTS